MKDNFGTIAQAASLIPWDCMYVTGKLRFPLRGVRYDNHHPSETIGDACAILARVRNDSTGRRSQDNLTHLRVD